VLVPSDDPPFVAFCLSAPESEVRLRTREGRDLIRRLEQQGGHGDLVARIFAARRAPFPQRFQVSAADEEVVLSALDGADDLGPRLSELCASLQERRDAA
jgi:hypothetical protein